MQLFKKNNSEFFYLKNFLLQLFLFLYFSEIFFDYLKISYYK